MLDGTTCGIIYIQIRIVTFSFRSIKLYAI